MSTEVTNPRWKGLLASFILPGAGQFFQGRWKIAAFAFLIAYGSLPILLLLLTVPLAPPIFVLLLIPVLSIASLYFLVDACRPTPKIGWRGWLIIIVINIAAYSGEKTSVLSAYRVYSVPTEAMSPTIQKGDSILCLRAAYWLSPPQRGDIVVFPHQLSSGKDSIFLKRLIGLPGDVLKFKDGSLLVNDIPYRYPGQTVDYEPKIALYPDPSSSSNQTYSVPTGMVYVLGDNPPHSSDSRYFGTIPLSSLKGKITVVLWPINHMRRIAN